MSNIDKQALADIRRAAIAVARDGRTDDEWFYYLQCVHHKNVLALLDELETKEEQRANWFQMAQKLGEDLEAAEKCIAELQDQKIIMPKLPSLGADSEWYQ